MSTTFGERVVVYRNRLGMRQNALADRAGLTPSHLNRIEKGARRPPEADTVLRMAGVLRLSAEEAEAFVTSAGYSPLILRTGHGLSYSSPTVAPPSDDRLSRAISSLPEESRERCVDALLSLIDALRAVDPPPGHADKGGDDA